MTFKEFYEILLGLIGFSSLAALCIALLIIMGIFV